jgi:phosphoglycerol transferase MdoB-like AlkP superfamily enzyme
MEKWIEIRKKLSWISIPLCFFSFLTFDFALRSVYSFVGDTPLFALQPVLFSVSWSAMLSCLIGLLPKLIRRIAVGFFGVLFFVLSLVHGAMYNIFGKFFTFSDLSFAGDGAKFFSWSYLHFRKLFLLLLFAGLLLAAASIVFVPEKASSRKNMLVRKGICLGVALLSIIPIGWMHQESLPKEDSMWWGNAYDPTSQAESYKSFTDPNRCMMYAGLYQYTVRDFLVSFGLEGDFQSVENLNTYYSEKQVSGDNEMTGVLQGKNLIMIMMESMDTWMITEDYTPNLWKLQQESVNFANHYTPLFLSAGTFNTEITSLTGLIPAVSGLASSAYSTNAFPLALPNLFREAGYTVNSFHPASGDIYSRKSVHTNLGFSSYNSHVQMNMDDYMLDSQMINGYDLMTAGEPFYSFIITYSGHGPYTEESANISDPHMEAAKAAVAKSGITGSEQNMSEYTYAIAHAMETDQFIGELMDRLEQDGLLEDTVLVLYGDHYGKYMTDDSFLKQLKQVGDSETELYHTPFFLYSKDLAPQTVEKVSSTADIVPTLVNLFGLKNERQYYVGDDIFGDMGGYVIFPNYAWYDGTTYYDGSSSGEETEEIQQRTQEVKDKLNASWDTLKSDYFAYWDEPEE